LALFPFLFLNPHRPRPAPFPKIGMAFQVGFLFKERTKGNRDHRRWYASPGPQRHHKELLTVTPNFNITNYFCTTRLIRWES
jgi:hypothetical protein